MLRQDARVSMNIGPKTSQTRSTERFQTFVIIASNLYMEEISAWDTNLLSCLPLYVYMNVELILHPNIVKNRRHRFHLVDWAGDQKRLIRLWIVW